MKHIIKNILILAGLLCVNSCSFTPDEIIETVLIPSESTQHPRFTLYSKHTKTEYTMYVRLPYKNGIRDSETPYPVLFFLDGDFLAGKCMQDYERLQKAQSVEPAILVCIGYGKGENFRVRDLTPTLGAADIRKEPWCKNPGGAESFAQFLIGELIPEVEERYPVSTTRSDRAIFGHSFGGLFTAWLALEHTEAFGMYCSASPSIWWDSGILIGLERNYAALYSDLEAFWHFGWTDGEGAEAELYAGSLVKKLQSRVYPSLSLSVKKRHTGQHTTSFYHIYPDAM